MDRLNGIEVFVQVVEAGSFALAAERLQLTRSAVAKTIARLEARLDVRLFHRTTRTQSLTEDGQAYYEHCQRALAEIAHAEDALEAGRREPVGRLRVTAPVVFGRMCVAPFLLPLAAEYPRLEIDMVFTDGVVDLVEEGFDLGVRVGRLPDSTSLAARPLGTIRMAIVAAPAYLERHGRPADIGALAGHTGIVYHRPWGDTPWYMADEQGQTQAVRVASRVRLDDLDAIAGAALAGVGLAWLPCWLIGEHVRSGRLVMVFDDAQVRSTPVHAVWPHGRRMPVRTRVAIDALVAGVPALLSPD